MEVAGSSASSPRTNGLAVSELSQAAPFRKKITLDDETRESSALHVHNRTAGRVGQNLSTQHRGKRRDESRRNRSRRSRDRPPGEPRLCVNATRYPCRERP